ncbi:MAG: SEC-C domain-containing protein [Solirubrobacteraceae bacterium]|nr:SEC-C domain-containing protein [Solirubrobacteraceae bacterium]
MTRTPTRCPCGSGEPYADCCGALHRGRAGGDPTAPTAERLMRSRYSAFAVGDAAYLLATWHPSTRPPSIDLDPEVDWRQLQVVDTVDGEEDDDTGIVEFVATYRVAPTGQFGQQRERSAFRRLRGQWHYVGLAN